ncbi:MAG: Na/Pi symporter [Firmicutes bacterium]|nr:Na/Pi symporter [Bacillota bacterium]
MFWDIFYSVLLLLTGIGVFLVGIVKFSNFLQTNANDKIRGTFQKMGDNRFVGFGVGAGVTTVIQSSTATTVIVVGLVNAGIMTFGQSTAVIFGANVGSALSNMLLSLSAFRIKYFFMVLVFFGAFSKILFPKSKRLCKVSDIFISFGIIFVGLEVMSMAFAGSDYLTNAFASMFEAASFPLLLILLGFILTAIMNSSTAATAMFITLAANGVLSFVEIIYLVIGSRLGTTLTTLIASITANKNAKRAAMMHLMFNLFSTIIFLPIIWPLQGIIAPFFEGLVPDPVWQISIFSLVLNVLTAIILLSFIKPMNKLVFWIIKDVPEQLVIAEVAETPPENEPDFKGFTEGF